ncbi:MAG TPA: EscT/YscT/HrcT family type III secretion system export apparatus protein, partial [Noviherbaspirillum sp.]|nr:EscT/YscT/HrcT family type III secretion system export apparatus protein [Noviherbaspirillum sp.]
MQSSFLLDIQAGAMTMALVAPRVIICLVILPGFGLNVLTGTARYLAAMSIALPAALPTFYYIQETPP